MVGTVLVPWVLLRARPRQLSVSGSERKDKKGQNRVGERVWSRETATRVEPTPPGHCAPQGHIKCVNT